MGSKRTLTLSKMTRGPCTALTVLYSAGDRLSQSGDVHFLEPCPRDVQHPNCTPGGPLRACGPPWHPSAVAENVWTFSGRGVSGATPRVTLGVLPIGEATTPLMALFYISCKMEWFQEGRMGAHRDGA